MKSDIVDDIGYCCGLLLNCHCMVYMVNDESVEGLNPHGPAVLCLPCVYTKTSGKVSCRCAFSCYMNFVVRL